MIIYEYYNKVNFILTKNEINVHIYYLIQPPGI